MPIFFSPSVTTSIRTDPTPVKVTMDDSYTISRKVSTISTFAPLTKARTNIDCLHLDKAKTIRSRPPIHIQEAEQQIENSSYERIKILNEELKDNNKVIENPDLERRITKMAIENKRKEDAFEYKNNQSIKLRFQASSTQRGPSCKIAALSGVIDYLFMSKRIDHWLPAYKTIKTRSLCPDLKVTSTPSSNIELAIIWAKQKTYQTYLDPKYVTIPIDKIDSILEYEKSCIREAESIHLQLKIRAYQESCFKPVKHSIRQIAKIHHGSVQGEVVSPEMLEMIAYSIGLLPEKTRLHTIDEFREKTISKLHKKYPVMTFTQGFPGKEESSRSNAQWEEHAIIIIGYEDIEDSFIYVDAGGVRKATIEKLWNLMCITPEKREMEFYMKNGHKDPLVSFACDINTPAISLAKGWHDCEQMLDQHKIYPRIKNLVYFETDKEGENHLDKKGLDNANLDDIKYLRKSRRPGDGDTNFQRLIMTFDPPRVV